MLGSLVFNVVPTAIEAALVAGILTYTCGPAFGVLTVATIAAYTVYTFWITQWRQKFRCRAYQVFKSCNDFLPCLRCSGSFMKQ